VASRSSPAHDLEQLALGCRDQHGRGVDATAVDVRIDGMAARRDAGDGDGAIWATPEGTWLAPAKDEPHLADTALYGLLLPPGNAVAQRSGSAFGDERYGREKPRPDDRIEVRGLVVADAC
jgi:hypothetical protein